MTWLQTLTPPPPLLLLRCEIFTQPRVSSFIWPDGKLNGLSHHDLRCCRTQLIVCTWTNHYRSKERREKEGKLNKAQNVSNIWWMHVSNKCSVFAMEIVKYKFKNDKAMWYCANGKGPMQGASETNVWTMDAMDKVTIESIRFYKINRCNNKCFPIDCSTRRDDERTEWLMNWMDHRIRISLI